MRSTLLLPLVLITVGTAFAEVPRDADGVIRVETVLDLNNSFVFDESPAFDDGRPAYGNDFIIQGVIYPAGTVTPNGNKGMNPDGTPEFPDLVIGEWTCWGRFIGDGANTSAGAFVMSTQVFSFGANPDYGPATIVTTGYEAVDGPVQRAITGGTGEFGRAAGGQRQVIMAGGRNGANGLNMSHELMLDNSLLEHLMRMSGLLERMAIRLGLVP